MNEAEHEAAAEQRSSMPPLVTHTEPVEGALTWQIGQVTVRRLVESVIELPPRALLPDLGAELVASCGEWAAPFFTEDGATMLLSVHSFVIEGGGATIVVDTCIADHSPHVLPGGFGFVDKLNRGITGGFEAVDYVVATHLHFDHVGWNTRRIGGEWVPTFPNARYLASEAELAGVLELDEMGVLDASVQPLLDRGLFDAVPSDHRVTDQVRLIPTPGHSPGHVCVLIESDGERALITGDATHSPVQFAYPEVSATPADHDSVQATETRHSMLELLTDQDILVLGSHFTAPTAGHVRSGAERAWFDTER